MKTNASKSVNFKSILKCFIVGFITASIVFVPYFINRKGALIVYEDYITQYLPFAQTIWKAVHNGDQWVWNIDLGCSLVNGFSYYGLGSPFLWISLLFPSGSFLYLSGILMILKYAVATVCAYIYLSSFKREESQKDYAMLGALLYAFSGFQSMNIVFGIFHDEVAFFPLLLWGIENIDNKKKRPFFILAIFINCLVNYFLFIQDVIFMIVYFVIRYWDRRSVKEFFARMLSCLMCGVLGVGMASILFVPNILYITGNTRSGALPYLSNLFYDTKTLLYTIRGMLFPADVMRDNFAFYVHRWHSTSCYLPLFGLSGVIAFMLKNKGWLHRLLVLLFVISALPLVQSVFLLFTVDYQRWWYMFVLVMVLATTQVLERPDEYSLSKGNAIYIALVTGFYLIVTLLPWDKKNEQIIFHQDRFNYYFVLAVFGVIMVDILIRTNRFSFNILMTMVIACCIVTTAITLHYYRLEGDSKAFMEKYEASLGFKELDPQYRFNTIDNVVTCVGYVAGTGTYLSSTFENSSHEFDLLLGTYDGVHTRKREKLEGAGQLLGGKYIISYDVRPKNYIYEVSSGNTAMYVSEDKAVPIGVAMDKYIFANELYKLPGEQRVKALMNSAVIIPSNEQYVENAMEHIDASSIDFGKPIEDLISGLEKDAVKDFSRDGHGFSCTTDYDTDKVVFFSVPDDDGWTARIDGQRADIIDSGGLMLLYVPKGEHVIDFSYHTVGLSTGVFVSIISWIFYAGLVFVTFWSKRSKGEMYA